MSSKIHVCPNCGRRIKCDQPARKAFEMDGPVAASLTTWPTIQYETFWAVDKVADALGWSAAAWIVTNAIIWPVAMYNQWPEVIPMAYSIISYPIMIRVFGKVPSWHNQTQAEPPARVEAEPRDTRRFVGWQLSIASGTSEHTLEYYLPPVPIPEARSYALAVVNNGFNWVSERKLKAHRANISQSQYFALRDDWIRRRWCRATNDGKTIVHKRNIIYRIAFEDPK